MRLRFLAVVAAAGLFLAPTLAQQPTPPAAPLNVPSRVVDRPKPCDAVRRADIPPPPPIYVVEPPPLYYSPDQPALHPTRELANQEIAAGFQKTAERQVVKSYAVADLVVPPPPVGGCCAFATDKVKTCERELIKKIITTIEPKSWSGAGGTGSIEYYPLGVALVINHTPEVQAAVARYLDSLRKLQDLQVTMSVHVVTISDECWGNCDLAKEFAHCDAGCISTKAKGMVVKHDALQKLMCSAQKDPGTSALAAPKLTLLNGQPGQLRVGQSERFVTGFTVKSVNGNVVYVPKTEDHEMGMDLAVEPTISDDGVRLMVSGSLREHAVLPIPMTPVTTLVPAVSEKGKKPEPAPFTQFIQEPKIMTRTVGDTVVVPDGGSVVFYGGSATIEETVKEPLGIPSNVPGVTFLSEKDKKTTTTNHLLVVMTPHICRPDSGVEQCAACCPGDGKLAKLLADYKRACREGKTDDARRLAIECLAIDAKCFGAK
jgi:Bacterial type II and III secretion system protein